MLNKSQYLSKHFRMSAASPSTFLGINIKFDGFERRHNSISIDQSGYINRALNHFRMENSRPAFTPLEASVKPHKYQYVSTKYQDYWFPTAPRICLWSRYCLRYFYSRTFQRPANRNPYESSKKSISICLYVQYVFMFNGVLILWNSHKQTSCSL
jgi:hypothetical protein